MCVREWIFFIFFYKSYWLENNLVSNVKQNCSLKWFIYILVKIDFSDLWMICLNWYFQFLILISCVCISLTGVARVHAKKKNDICTTPFWQLCDNFISHTHIIFLSYLFFSPLFLTNEKKEKWSCHKCCIK